MVIINLMNHIHFNFQGVLLDFDVMK